MAFFLKDISSLSSFLFGRRTGHGIRKKLHELMLCCALLLFFCRVARAAHSVSRSPSCSRFLSLSLSRSTSGDEGVCECVCECRHDDVGLAMLITLNLAYHA